MQKKKHERLIPGQKELLTLFDNLLDAILADKTLMSSKDENKKLKKEKKKLKEEIDKKLFEQIFGHTFIKLYSYKNKKTK